MMDIQNIVTDQDTELLDSEITEISHEFAETYYFDNGKIEELEALVTKAMKLGELYERKKWQEGSAVPDGFVLVPKECSDEMAEVIAATARVCGGIAGDVYDAVVKQAMVEAAEHKENL